MVKLVIDGAPCRRCQLENDPRTALLYQDQFHRFHLRTQPWLWKLVSHRLPNDHDCKLSLWGVTLAIAVANARSVAVMRAICPGVQRRMPSGRSQSMTMSARRGNRGR